MEDLKFGSCNLNLYHFEALRAINNRASGWDKSANPRTTMFKCRLNKVRNTRTELDAQQLFRATPTQRGCSPFKQWNVKELETAFRSLILLALFCAVGFNKKLGAVGHMRFDMWISLVVS